MINKNSSGYFRGVAGSSPPTPCVCEYSHTQTHTHTNMFRFTGAGSGVGAASPSTHTHTQHTHTHHIPAAARRDTGAAELLHSVSVHCVVQLEAGVRPAVCACERCLRPLGCPPVRESEREGVSVYVCVRVILRVCICVRVQVGVHVCVCGNTVKVIVGIQSGIHVRACMRVCVPTCHHW